MHKPTRQRGEVKKKKSKEEMVLKVVIAGKVFKVFQSEREKEEAKVENGTS